MKKIKLILAVLLLPVTSSLYAEGSYIGGSLGLMADLGMLGRTITIDGLDSNLVSRPDLTGTKLGTGCAGAPNPDQCNNEIKGGTKQKAIIAENQLIALEKNTGGLFQTKAGGSMTGGIINLFWEKENSFTFWRVGVAYNRKISGGHTESSLAGIQWYNVTWDYSVFYAPMYFGMKTAISDNGTNLYGALGLSYFEGGWSVGGKNIGDIPTTLVGNLVGAQGVVTVRDPDTGATKGGAMMYESARFKTNGWGFAAMLGVEGKVTDRGDKIFLEVNHIFAGGMASTTTKDIGGMRHMTAAPTYPVTLAGTFFTFGYKKAM